MVGSRRTRRLRVCNYERGRKFRRDGCESKMLLVDLDKGKGKEEWGEERTYGVVSKVVEVY